jgi:hypothetical protein
MRASLTALLLLLLPVAGCEKPPPSAYVHGAAAAGKPASQIAIGKNAVGEDCTQSAATGASAAVYCGTWEEPSAHVRSGGTPPPARGAPRSTRASAARRRRRQRSSAAIRPS